MCGVIKVHDFNDSLKRSHEAENLPIWEEVYRKAFPQFVKMITYRADGFWQREGVDRGIMLSTTKQILIDEKIRSKDYGDILLEYISSDRSGSKGWVCKPLRADYIAYLIAPSGICYLLPVIQLQNAWSKYGEKWIKKYKKIVAPNKGYNTISVGVPIKELWPKIGNEFRVNFNPFCEVEIPNFKMDEPF